MRETIRETFNPSKSPTATEEAREPTPFSLLLEALKRGFPMDVSLATALLRTVREGGEREV